MGQRDCSFCVVSPGNITCVCLVCDEQEMERDREEAMKRKSKYTEEEIEMVRNPL